VLQSVVILKEQMLQFETIFSENITYTLLLLVFFFCIRPCFRTAYSLLMLRPTCSEVWCRSCRCCWRFHQTFIQPLRHLMTTTLSFSIQVSLLIRPCNQTAPVYLLKHPTHMSRCTTNVRRVERKIYTTDLQTVQKFRCCRDTRRLYNTECLLCVFTY